MSKKKPIKTEHLIALVLVLTGVGYAIWKLNMQSKAIDDVNKNYPYLMDSTRLAEKVVEIYKIPFGVRTTKDEAQIKTSKRKLTISTAPPFDGSQSIKNSLSVGDSLYRKPFNDTLYLIKPYHMKNRKFMYIVKTM